MSARDNFFDLKSWLPPQPRRLAEQWLGQWANGLNNLALDVGMLKVGMNGKMDTLIHGGFMSQPNLPPSEIAGFHSRPY